MTSSAILSAFMAAVFGSPTLTPDVSVEDGPHGSARYAAVAARLGIRVVEARGPGNRLAGTVRWTAADPELYAEVARYFALHLDHLPPSLVKAAGWKELILCQELTDQGKACGGIASGGTIWLSLGVKRPFRTSITLYHEFFHALEQGLVRSGRIRDQDLADWKAIAHGGGDLTNEATNDRLDAIDRWTKGPSSGFISAYAASAPIEDRAEVFAHLVFLPKVSERRAAADPTVRRKVDWIRNLVREACPDLPADFWANPDPNMAVFDR